MQFDEIKNIIIKSIDSFYSQKGFIPADFILEFANVHNLQLSDIDRLTEFLLNQNYILKDDVIPLDDLDDIQVDHSRTDYENLFQRVEKIEPSLAGYLNLIKQIEPPQTNESNFLLFQAKQGNQYARLRIISMNLRFVVKIALSYYDKYKFKLSESIQDGNVGLIIALDKISIDSNNNFTAYASWWIRQKIERYANINDSLYIPSHVKTTLIQIKELQKKYGFDLLLNKTELLNKIVDQLSVDYDTAQKYILLLESPISVDEIIKLENLETKYFSDNSEYFDNYIEYIDNQLLRLHLDKIFMSLSEFEYKIITSRFGFLDGQEKTLEEIGNQFNLTRERIRQIESKIIRKIINSNKKELLKSFIS